MKRFLSKHWAAVLTLLFGVAVFLFWRFKYPAALAYQEELQLFLFDADYLASRLALPGGLARYVGELLTQFYNNVTLGALILALLLMLIRQLTAAILPRTPLAALLSFLPAILLWATLGDESVLLGYVVALAMALGAIRLFPRQKHARWACIVVGIPLLYWLIGPLVLLVAACVMPLSVVYALACIVLSAHLLPYPLTRLMLGIGYYRFGELTPYTLIAIPVVVLALYYAARLLPAKLKHRAAQPKHWAVAAVGLTLAALCFAACHWGFDAKKYELIDYDYLVRSKNWPAIIAKAERQQPDLPMSVSATNLALAMTDQLGERLFDFYQRSSEGLLPPFERNFNTSMLTGEVYFHLGLVNTAQRFAFEAMEALPDYNKSARCVKRLAETNLVNGQYDVARKYLHLLEKTVFYRRWAQRTLALMADEKQVNDHPLYGWLRQARLDNDFLFSEQETDKICGQLFMHNPQNTVAMQYLLAMPLLDRDLDRFMQYVQTVQQRVAYNPRSCQEAIALAFLQRQKPIPQGAVSPLVQQRLQQFSRAYSTGGADSPQLAAFRNTVWYYFVEH